MRALISHSFQFTVHNTYKQFFRRHTDHVGSHLHQNILKAMSEEVLPLARVRKYARKARSYRRAYHGDTSIDRADIEKHVKLQKTHRAADRLDWKWLMEN